MSACVQRVRVCDQVDNSCFCSLCRLVFQDISGRLAQVGFTHSVWEPVCILPVSNDCVLLDIIDHLRLKCLLCLFLLTHWILTGVELRKGEKRKSWNLFETHILKDSLFLTVKLNSRCLNLRVKPIRFNAKFKVFKFNYDWDICTFFTNRLCLTFVQIYIYIYKVVLN